MTEQEEKLIEEVRESMLTDMEYTAGYYTITYDDFKVWIADHDTRLDRLELLEVRFIAGEEDSSMPMMLMLNQYLHDFIKTQLPKIIEELEKV